MTRDRDGLNRDGTTSVGLAYDPLGRLRATHTSADVWTYFLYAGDQMIGEYALNTGGAAALRRYVHGPGVDEPLVWYEGSGGIDRRWLHADRQGSIIAVSNAAGAVTPLSYGPYGEPSDWTGPRFRYTGQAALPEVQAYHYKARVYDPAMGRFLQTDPIGQDDDPNLYGYVRGDPTNQTDPTGNCPWCLGAAIGVGVEVAVQLSSGELQHAVSDARNGNFGALAVSAGKIGVSGATGAVGGTVVKAGISLVAKGAEALGAGARLTQVAKVGAVAVSQGGLGAASKVATNGVQGKPLGTDVGKAAVVSAAVGTAGHYVAGAAGDRAAAVIATKVVTSGAKKEGSCVASAGKPC